MLAPADALPPPPPLVRYDKLPITAASALAPFYAPKDLDWQSATLTKPVGTALSERVTLYRLTQEHDFPLEQQVPGRIRQAIIASQFRNAQFLLAHPNAIVIDEGLPCTLNATTLAIAELLLRQQEQKWLGGRIDPGKLAQPERDYFTYLDGFYAAVARKVCATFPDGFPAQPGKLSKQQQDLLISFGAARVLVCLGLIQEVRRSASLEEHLETNQVIQTLALTWGTKWNKHLRDPEVNQLVYEKREQQIVRETNTARVDALKESRPIILCFGRLHKFKGVLDAAHFDFVVPPGFPKEGSSPTPTLAFSGYKDYLGLSAVFGITLALLRKRVGAFLGKFKFPKLVSDPKEQP